MKHPDPPVVSTSRRAFLRGIPVRTAAAGLPAPALAADGRHHWAMLVDGRKCIGCQVCTVAPCKAHG